jgi:hypothetical protein
MAAVAAAAVAAAAATMAAAVATKAGEEMVASGVEVCKSCASRYGHRHNHSLHSKR